MYHQVQEIFCTKEKRKSKVVKLNRIMKKKGLFLSIQNRSGRKCSRMANSSALPFPIPSGTGDVVPLDEGIRDCGE